MICCELFDYSSPEHPTPIGQVEFEYLPRRGDYVEVVPVLAPPRLYEVIRAEHRGVHESARETMVGRDAEPTTIVHVQYVRTIVELL